MIDPCQMSFGGEHRADRRQGEALLAVDSSAMFVLIGLVPHTAWLDGQIPLDEKGLATEDVSEQPLRYR